MQIIRCLPLILSTGLTSLWLISCATQVVGGAALDKSNSATIVAPSKVRTWLDPTETWAPTILTLDGVGVGSGTSKVVVTPGHHTLTSYCGTDSRNPQQLEVDAVAGATYELMFLVPGQGRSCTVSLREK
jgi:hypothetical protein